MRKILSLLLLMAYGTVLAQAEGPTSMVKPEVTPPSPQAYALTKYGDIPINEFTGMVNANIPIYTVKVGKIELPISLNYAAAGVKVNQTSTWTGINWTLNAGGVISRTINDAPDESISADKRLTADMIIPNQLINGSAHAYFLNGVFVGARKHYDFKPDLWSYSFGTYSGTFYLDGDFVPHFSKLDSNLKIEIVGTNSDLRQRFRDSNEFCITTPEGVKYYFGGANACESSFMGSHRDNPYANTGFYLNKIQHPDYGVILFEYDTDTLARTIWANEEESITINNYENYQEAFCKRPPTQEGEHLIHSTGYVTMNGKYLKRIYSPHSYLQVLFNKTNGSGGQYMYVLNSIEIKEGSTVMRKADFTYLFPQTQTTSERFFLTKVEFDKDRNYGFGHGRKNEEYLIEYNDPLGLPNRRSQAKDLAGYYNGRTGNTTALPQNEDIQFNNYYPNLANRTPDFNYSVKGTLKKITYPTKGYTLFEYESQKAKEYERQHKSMMIWRNNPGRIPTSRTNTSTLLGEFIQNPDGTFGTSAAVIDEVINVRVELTSNAQMGHTDRIYFKLVDQTAGTTETVTIQMPDGNQEIGTGAFNYTREFTVNVLKDHIYTVEFSNNYSSIVKFEASAYFSNIKGFRTIDENGGLRVMRTTDFTAENQSAFVKRYYYQQAKNLLVDPYSLLNFKMNFSFVKDLFLTKCCNPRPPSEIQGPALLTHTGVIELRTFSSAASFTEAFDKKYEYVTISYGGDDFELGGKQKWFNTIPVASNQEIHPFNNSPFQDEMAMYRGNLESIYHGTLLSEIDLIKKDNKFYKVKEQSFEYDYEELGTMSGVTGGYAHMNCSYPTDGADNLDIGKFEYFSKKVNLVSKTQKEFTIPMPITIDALFESNYKPIVTKTDYTYGALAGLPTRIKTVTSENNGYSEIQNTYANQASSLSGLTSAQLIAYNKLVEKNKISTPIEIKAYKTDNGSPILTATQRTLYKNWGTTIDLILPEIMQFAKGDQSLEDRILLNQYDNRGNLLLVSAANGSLTKYEYDGYDNVTVKIENFTGTANTTVNVPNVPIDFVPGTPAPCTFNTAYPGAIVTWYYYDTFSRLLRRIVDTNCRSTYYEYDALFRLKRIKDHDGNVIEEYDNNYRIN